MPYRLVGRAASRIDEILFESARRWGIDAAARYHRLILAAMAEIGDRPDLVGSREIPRVAGPRTYHPVSYTHLMTLTTRAVMCKSR